MAQASMRGENIVTMENEETTGDRALACDHSAALPHDAQEHLSELQGTTANGNFKNQRMKANQGRTRKAASKRKTSAPSTPTKTRRTQPEQHLLLTPEKLAGVKSKLDAAPSTDGPAFHKTLIQLASFFPEPTNAGIPNVTVSNTNLVSQGVGNDEISHSNSAASLSSTSTTYTLKQNVVTNRYMNKKCPGNCEVCHAPCFFGPSHFDIQNTPCRCEDCFRNGSITTPGTSRWFNSTPTQEDADVFLNGDLLDKDRKVIARNVPFGPISDAESSLLPGPKINPKANALPCTYDTPRRFQRSPTPARTFANTEDVSDIRPIYDSSGKELDARDGTQTTVVEVPNAEVSSRPLLVQPLCSHQERLEAQSKADDEPPCIQLHSGPAPPDADAQSVVSEKSDSLSSVVGQFLQAVQPFDSCSEGCKPPAACDPLQDSDATRGANGLARERELSLESQYEALDDFAGARKPGQYYTAGDAARRPSAQANNMYVPVHSILRLPVYSPIAVDEQTQRLLELHNTQEYARQGISQQEPDLEERYNQLVIAFDKLAIHNAQLEDENALLKADVEEKQKHLELQNENIQLKDQYIQSLEIKYSIAPAFETHGSADNNSSMDLTPINEHERTDA